MIVDAMFVVRCRRVRAASSWRSSRDPQVASCRSNQIRLPPPSILIALNTPSAHRTQWCPFSYPSMTCVGNLGKIEFPQPCICPHLLGFCGVMLPEWAFDLSLLLSHRRCPISPLMVILHPIYFRRWHTDAFQSAEELSFSCP
jgi:hypothetical protein